ncbi:hypothetical protein [Mycobacteroides salmoniphilum]|uniref:Uncharacterized protein n=1 Tax=Mycobacteroides salmoniphilum TaxID=404941 RepID=A0A4V3I2M5_9MYCO|nr:hypothetical protein [Mycobacteroides salmoniphilum]TEA09064.1 hypothetical protein CCUG60884_00232 [Mycobacteroides salmoniphilum]
MTSADRDIPLPPAAVIEAVTQLRAAFDDLHEMHDCDENCLEDCELTDYSEAAYRDHDEHNFDVRETIETCADALVRALEEWLGSANLKGPGDPESSDGSS